MISWINFTVLISSSILFTIFYVKSVSPAALESIIGRSAFQKCATYRLVASVFMVVAAANYLLYYWFPLPLPLPAVFAWSWPISVLMLPALLFLPRIS